MNRDRLAKALATKQDKAKRFKTQTITVDENWRVVRADELNWEVQHRENGQWKFCGYFGRLLNAFEALPHKMLGEEAKSSIPLCLANQKAFLAKVEKALPKNL